MALFRVNRRRALSCCRFLSVVAPLSLYSASAFAEVRPVAWGRGTSGQLGRGSWINAPTPVAVTSANGSVLAGKTVTALAGGFDHSLALTSEGVVCAWGRGNNGQLGNGSWTNSSLPVAVSSSGALAGKTVTAIAAGVEHSVALSSDGAVYTWGSNSVGQLGTGTTLNTSSVPVEVSTSGALAGKTITAIAASNYHCLALASDGTLYAWGNGTNGELGNGSTSAQRAPVPVTTSGTPLEGKVVTAIACGSNFSLALTSDGGLYSWGSNVVGQLGNGTGTSSPLPVAVSSSGALAGKTVSAIACGASFALALSSDGLVYGWGENYFGQLGTGNFNYSSVPVAATTGGALTGKTISRISTGVNYSLALDSGGQLYSWGDGEFGKLGTNSAAKTSAPTKVASSLTAVTLLSAGGHHALSLGDFRSLAPVASQGVATASSGQSSAIRLSGSDPEGDPLTFSIVSGPTQGTLSGIAPNLTYTAPADFTSADSFTFKVNDGTSDSPPATVIINPGEAPSLVVTTTSDVASSADYKTSLREAISYANRHDGPDVVTFNIPTTDTRFASGVFTINVFEALPALTDSGTTIDGASQTAFGGNSNSLGPEVALQGRIGANESLPAHALQVLGASCVIKGLSISNFRNYSYPNMTYPPPPEFAGVFVSGAPASGARILGCYIGTDPTGAIAQANGFGVLVQGASNVVIGGVGEAGRNVISGNRSDGVRVDSGSGTIVRNCFVGTNALGTVALGNFKGIALEASTSGSSIGGVQSGEGNVISGNRYDGLGIQGTSHVVRGNLIGTNAAGTSAVGNASGGVTLHNGAQNNTIGGTIPGARNVISGNREGGIYINYRSTGNNVIQGNFIGTDAAGTGAVGNQGRGIYLDAGTSGNVIGGVASSNYSNALSSNRIAFNTGDGISLLSDTLGATVRNNLRGNQIYNNGGLGINLSLYGETGTLASGVTPNDAGDGDLGANNYQNFPIITSATNGAKGLAIKGTLSSSASKTYAVDFYASASADPSGYGEGEVYLGTQSITTDSSGNASFAFTLPSVALGQSITATATDAEGNTSEFSQARAVVANSAPIASDQAVDAVEDSAVKITLGASDAEADSLTYSTVSAPTHGALSGTGASLTYTPEANFNGVDTFSFKVNDGTSNSNIATVSINVAGVNDAPSASDNAHSTPEGVALNVEAPGVLANDADIDGDALSAVLASDVAHGSLSLNANGSFSYTPEQDFNGTDRFTYKANDGKVDSEVASVVITVSAVNDAPSFTKGADQSVLEDAGAQTVAGWASNISAGPIDEAGQTLRFEVSNNNNALFSVAPAVDAKTGDLTYTPAPNANGTATVTVRLQDSGGTAGGGADTSVAQSFTITVRPVNDAPVATSDTYKVAAGTALVVSAPGVLANDRDVDTSVLSAVLKSAPTNGTVTLSANGSFTYKPRARYSGTDSFTYQASDGAALSNVATVTISVGGTDSTSSVQFSTGSASVRADRVTLTFSGPLNPASAADVARYQVQVAPSGSPVAQLYGIATASYDSASFTVTLTLNGDLQRNDQVVASWTNLLDSKGNALSGQSPILTAK